MVQRVVYFRDEVALVSWFLQPLLERAPCMHPIPELCRVAMWFYNHIRLKAVAKNTFPCVSRGNRLAEIRCTVWVHELSVVNVKTLTSRAKKSMVVLFIIFQVHGTAQEKGFFIRSARWKERSRGIFSWSLLEFRSLVRIFLNASGTVRAAEVTFFRSLAWKG